MEHEAIIEELRLSRQSRNDLQVFIREQTLRMERATQAMERATQAMERALRDMGEQLHANTRAVLVVLDRLEGGQA